MTDNLDGSGWYFYIWNNSFYYYNGCFQSGSIKVMIDEEAGAITVEVDAVARDGRVIQLSYTGPAIEYDSFLKVNS